MGSSVPSHDRDASDAAPWEGMSARRYLATRISTLRPPMVAMANPWRLLRMLNAQQWSFFGLAFFAWVSQLSPLMPEPSRLLSQRRHGTPLTSSASP